MSSVLEGSEHLERELTPEPVVGPATGAVVLHLALAAALLSYGALLGLFHHDSWGNQGAGAMQVSLVSSALPLPADQPPNQNVLATQTPSQAPEAPAKQTTRPEDETAIPIQGPHVKKEKKIEHKTQPHQDTPQQKNLARYGEQAGSVMPRMVQSGSNGPTTVGDNNFASQFGWYVDQINTKMAQNWNKLEVDPRTPKGSRVYLFFVIRRDGSPTSIQLERSSGSPTLDSSCVRAAQRVDSFGPLPGGYTQSSLRVSYYCEY